MGRRSLPIGKPRLRCAGLRIVRRKRQQLRHRPRRHQIISTQPRPVVKDKVILVDPRVDEKLPLHADSLSGGTINATISTCVNLSVGLAQMMQQQFRVKILADLIRQHNILLHLGRRMLQNHGTRVETSDFAGQDRTQSY